MSQSENNDPIQLKQTIIHLRAELNKYKNKYQQASSPLLDELQMENERLTNRYKELLHQNKKYEKRIGLYEQRIRSLESQRKESLTNLEHLQNTEQDLQTANKQLLEVLTSIGKDQHSETIEAFERLEMKVDSFLHQYIPSQNMLSLAENKISKLQLDLETSQKMKAAQFELITVLEEYIQQLTEESSSL